MESLDMAKCCWWLVVVTALLASFTTCKADLDWWQKAVIYQIYPLSFKDSNADSFGDLNGTTEKLDYLKDLGVDVVCMSNIFTTDMLDNSYSVTNFTNVNTVLGTMDDFERLINKSKNLGMKIILEFDPNHSSERHPWFTMSARRQEKYTDYYVWANSSNQKEGSFPNDWLTGNGNPAWEWSQLRKEYFLHQTWEMFPDFNYRSPDLRNEIENVMRFWLDKGVHGFNLIDTTLLFEDKMQRCEYNGNIAKRSLRSEGVSPFFMQNHSYTMNLDETYNIVCEWRQLMDEYKAKDGVTRVLITSAFPTVEDMMRYYGNDTHPGVHLVINPSFLLSSQKWNATIADLTIRLWQDNMPQKNWATWVTGNANVHRLSERFSPELVDIFHTLALLVPGTALTYYGDEIGMREPEVPYSQTHDIEGLQVGPDNYTQFSTDPARTPFQWDNSTNAGFSEASTTWLPIHSNYEDLNLANEMSKQSNYHLFKKLAHARKWSVIQEGDFKMHLFSPAVLSFCRTLSASDPVFAIINFMDKNETINLMLMKNAKQDMCIYASSENSGYLDRQSVMTNNLTLQPTSCLIVTTCERADGSAMLTTSSSTVLLLLSLSFVMFARHRLD